MLDENELAAMKKRLKKTPEGTYVVRDLFGEAWESMPDPKSYGHRFKASVNAGLLPGVRSVGRRYDNHQLYEVRSVKLAA